MTKTILALSMLFSTIGCFSQPKFHFENPENIKNYQVDGEKYRQYLTERYKDAFRMNQKYKEFISIMENAKSYPLSKLYCGWSDMETMVQNIVNELISESDINIYPSNTKVKVYIVKSTEVNASAFEDGSIFVNIGLIASCKNEAMLAGVLAHELGHYAHEDQLRGYKQFKTDQNWAVLMSLPVGIIFNVNLSPFPLMLMQQAHSRDHEREADEFARNLIKRSKYNPKGLLETFQLLKWIDDKEKLRTKGLKSSIYSSHPSPESRIDLVRAMQSSIKSATGQNYVTIIEEQYLNLRSMAKDEVMYLNSIHDDHFDAMEYFFKKHILDPQNPYYLDHLIHHCSSFLLNNEKVIDEPFITSEYNVKENMQDIKIDFIQSSYPNLKKEAYRSIFFHKSEILLMFKEEIQKSEDYTSSNIPFFTYKEALEHFVKLSQALGVTQNFAFAGVALKNQSILDLYLNANSSAYHKPYLKCYQAQDFSVSSSSKLVVLYDPTMYKNSMLDNQKENTAKAKAFDKYHASIKQQYQYLAGDHVFKTYEMLNEKEKSLMGRIIQNIVHAASKRKFVGSRYQQLEAYNVLVSSPIFMQNLDIWMYFYENKYSQIDFVSINQKEDVMRPEKICNEISIKSLYAQSSTLLFNGKTAYLKWLSNTNELPREYELKWNKRLRKFFYQHWHYEKDGKSILKPKD